MDELELEFELHPQLAQDCILLGEFPLCRLLLINDANYPWFVLVPRRAGVSEIYHLSSDDQVQLMRESCFLAENLADTFAARKMNVASLGNMVPQLHLHHIVRFEKDPAWPGPVWGKLPARSYTDEQVGDIRTKLQSLMSGELSFVPQPV
ncbi:HIT domain-containing protein [Marinobacterium rhizophilum]|uniref:HIT domain-containing protein n=1 Tax=Marinobacterium rhizophilum TaxID=420402 RepID=A0ABY5HMR7_9GAMM|nr:HIT domain-containing protein [Marinobacterium rhizophilum]UTW13711.1 HIT domain-containing protein [Marinobacterium rhizophilum]